MLLTDRTDLASLLTTWPGLLICILVGAIAGGINAVAGGGSLISFPALLGMGMPSVAANATNSCALWPGSLASAFGFLNKLRESNHDLIPLVPATLVGSFLGSRLLLVTGEEVFQIAVPILILFATLLVTFEPRIKRWSNSRGRLLSPAGATALQFCVSVYGGYFGAGMGLLMLAVLGLFIEGDIHVRNAVKVWLGLLINLTATVMFLLAKTVWLYPALALSVGTILGGYFAAVFSQRVDADKLRKAIATMGFVMVAWFTYEVIR